jgi:hypothetical protein
VNNESNGKSRIRPLAKQPSAPGVADNKQTEEITDVAAIIALVKDCDDAEAIEKQILDKTSQVNRTLLPLYVVYKHMNNRFSLTSGEISSKVALICLP